MTSSTPITNGTLEGGVCYTANPYETGDTCVVAECMPGDALISGASLPLVISAAAPGFYPRSIYITIYSFNDYVSFVGKDVNGNVISSMQPYVAAGSPQRVDLSPLGLVSSLRISHDIYSFDVDNLVVAGVLKAMHVVLCGPACRCFFPVLAIVQATTCLSA